MARSLLAFELTRFSLARPRWVVILTLVLTAGLASQALRVSSEVGFAAYFGPDHPGVERLSDFLDEFDSGLHVMIAFSCTGSTLCERVDEPAALDFLARVHGELDGLANVRRTTSILNAPILVGPFELRRVAHRDANGSFVLEPDHEALLERARDEPFVSRTLISSNAHAAGVIVELQSLESDRLRSVVREILERVPAYEAELGGELFLAGDPVWTVLSDDSLSADSRLLTVLMFVVIVGILYWMYGDLRLTLLPVATVGVLTVDVNGLVGLLGIPMTSIMAALAPLLVVISITVSVHFLTAFVRAEERDVDAALLAAADKVGPACFWASATTAGGFLSFLWSNLESFRNFGAMAACGMAIAFLLTFSLLPALISLTRRGLRRERSRLVPRIVLDTAFDAVRRRPGFVLLTGLGAFAALASGLSRIYYETDFGDQSYILRSVRFIEANLHKPMTTDLVVTFPEGQRIYDPDSLALLDRIEAYFGDEPSTGHVWSLLDLLSEAHRIDVGEPPRSIDQVIDRAPSLLPLVAAHDRTAAYWSESATERPDGRIDSVDRARVSVHRAWLDDQTQGPYLDRLRRMLGALNAELAGSGIHVDLEGGLPLSDLAVREIRATQLSSFASAFAVVLVVLAWVLRRNVRLLAWACVLNVLPIVSLLGLMGLLGIGVDPANTMVAAILLVIAVDDTIHVSLHYLRRRDAGRSVIDSLHDAIGGVGEAVIITSLCLALGFAVLLFSTWGGLVSFGLLATLGVLFALAADLFLLPAALLVTEDAKLPDVQTGPVEVRHE